MLLQHFFFHYLFLPDIQHGRSYGSLDDNLIPPVNIRIENDERTPLLMNHCHSLAAFNECEYDDDLYNDRLLTSFNSLDDNATTATLISTVPDARHNVEAFHWELRLVAFILLLLSSVALAIYLLIIECKL